MRVIAGRNRGRRLFAPEGNETRPTSDKVREALFSIICAEVPGAVVLDLFAGSGALALEALSRGAESAVLCDQSRRAAAVIRRNIELTGEAERARLICGDWQGALAGRFSLVFLDPPYRMSAVYAQAANRLLSGGHLRADALIVMEHAAGDFDAVTGGLSAPLYVAQTRVYRETALTFVRIGQEEGDGA